MIAQPSKTRYTIDNNGTSLIMFVPSRKRWLLALLLFVWLLWWVFSTTCVGGLLIVNIIPDYLKSGQTLGMPLWTTLIPGLLVVAWLTIWAYGGFANLKAFLWLVRGYEVVEINRHTISITRSVFGFEKPKNYVAKYISDFRVSVHNPPFAWPGSYAFSGRWYRRSQIGILAFDYDGKTIYFGDMNETEAKMALTDILRRYPKYFDHNEEPI